MVSFPNCKINLGLRILSRRADGYHDLLSVFYPVSWCDALEFVESGEFNFKAEGLKIDGTAEQNLCVKAYRLLQPEFDLPPLDWILYKNIPMRAGLGGGSADGAFALRMMNDHFALQLSKEQLKHYALQLGSDCPFFIENKPMMLTGKGEQLDQIDLDLSGYYIHIVYPGIPVNTTRAFQEYDANENRRMNLFSLADFRQQMQQPVDDWKHFLINDFEELMASLYPEIAMIKKQYYEAGAVYASMSGSGSALYALFQDKPPDIPQFRDFRKFEGHL